MSLLNVESYIFIKVFYLVLFCIHVCVDDVIIKKKKLKRLEKSGSLSTSQYKKIKAVRSWPGILYGLCKLHKAFTDICPPFRPIISAFGTPSYKLAKFLVPKLSSITFKEFTVKDFFCFCWRNCTTGQ